MKGGWSASAKSDGRLAIDKLPEIGLSLAHIVIVAAKVVWEVTTLERKKVNDMAIPKSVGMILLAIWLILTGLISLFNLTFPEISIVMGLLALVAGILILIGR